MTSVSASARSGRRSFEEWPTLAPGWWLVVAWMAMDAVQVWSAGQARWGLDLPATRVVAGVLFAIGAVGVRAAGEQSRERVRPYAVILAVLAGLLSVLIAPSGIGEVPLFTAAARIPLGFAERTSRMVVVAVTIATAAVIGYVSHSAAGAIAGIGVPFLAQRSVDRRALVEQRDRARAMVVEVEAGREAETQAAALRERAHIAREMHDVLAHSLAGLSLQLQAARALAQSRDPRALDAIDRAAELARDGLAEARNAVGTLKTPTPHGIEDVPALVGLHPGKAAVTVTGTPAMVTAEAGHAVYRAVQESLTNAARYAPGSAVRVALAWESELLRVDIRDDGAAPGHQPLQGQGSGMGLAGMRERLEGVGGAVEAGPVGRGWRVALRVPTVPADSDVPGGAAS